MYAGTHIIAVTGGRDYEDYAHVKRVLDEEQPKAVIQGECPYGGLDRLAKRWCRQNGIPCIGIEALWDFYGRAAGPLRNGWMLDLIPIYKLIAFPGDRGTNNCVTQAYAREILVRDERGQQLRDNCADGTKSPSAGIAWGDDASQGRGTSVRSNQQGNASHQRPLDGGK